MFHKCNVKWIFVSRNCHIYIRTEICTTKQKYMKQNAIYYNFRLYKTQKYIRLNAI